jgi:hypothetical protein
MGLVLCHDFVQSALALPPQGCCNEIFVDMLSQPAAAPAHSHHLHQLPHVGMQASLPCAFDAPYLLKPCLQIRFVTPLLPFLMAVSPAYCCSTCSWVPIIIHCLLFIWAVKLGSFTPNLWPEGSPLSTGRKCALVVSHSPEITYSALSWRKKHICACCMAAPW